MLDKDELAYSQALMQMLEQRGFLNKVRDGWTMPQATREYIRGLTADVPDESERVFVLALKRLLEVFEEMEKK